MVRIRLKKILTLNIILVNKMSQQSKNLPVDAQVAGPTGTVEIVEATGETGTIESE